MLVGREKSIENIFTVIWKLKEENTIFQIHLSNFGKIFLKKKF